MIIHDTAVTDRQNDFDQIWELLTATHRPAGDGQPPWVNGWSFCRFESWLVFSAPEDPAALNERLHLWRTPEGRLAGFAITEGLGRDFHIVTDPELREAEPTLEGTIVSWVERTWPAEGETWVTYADAADTTRHAVLSDLGYSPGEPSETMHTYDLERPRPAPALPPGFSISSAAEDGDLRERSRLISMIFHPERDPRTAPPPVSQTKRSYDPNLDLVVRTPGGRQGVPTPVATAAGYINATNRTSEIEPVGTLAAFRQRGLARAVILAVFQRLRDRGIRWVHIASAPEPAVSNRLYTSLEPALQQHTIRWTKPRRDLGGLR